MMDLLSQEEQTLIDFITNKLTRHCSPHDLLSDLRMVLEDDADVFVQKLWKILIFYAISEGS